MPHYSKSSKWNIISVPDARQQTSVDCKMTTYRVMEIPNMMAQSMNPRNRRTRNMVCILAALHGLVVGIQAFITVSWRKNTKVIVWNHDKDHGMGISIPQKNSGQQSWSILMLVKCIEILGMNVVVGDSACLMAGCPASNKLMSFPKIN